MDLSPEPGQRAPFRFTFRWSDAWEGRDYEVSVCRAASATASG